MAEPSVIGAYLRQLDLRLARHGRRVRRRLVAEAREHLIDAARSAMEAGMEPTDAQHEAILRFGSAEQVADGLGSPPLLRQAVRPLLVAAVALTFLSVVVYTFGQQGLRHEANDPQLPIARELANRLASGSSLADVASGPAVDLANDPRVHVSVFDVTGRELASTATLDGRAVHPPTGVLSFALHHGTNEVTWQPRPGVRIAAVVVPWRSGTQRGTVLVGRSMRAVERDETALFHDVIVGWLIALTLALAAVLIWTRWRRPPSTFGRAPSPAPAPAAAN